VLIEFYRSTYSCLTLGCFEFTYMNFLNNWRGNENFCKNVHAGMIQVRFFYFTVILYTFITLKEKIGRIWHSIFNWL